MIRFIIFDLDGTLLNTIGDLAASANHALRQHGFPEHSLSEYPYFVGNGITKLIERALPEEKRDETTILRVRQEFVEYYQQHKTDLTCIYPGISELLEELKHRGFLLAVASNKYQQGTTELVEHYFGTSLFSAVAGQREGIPIKPDPTIIYNLLAQTGVLPTESLYIGDSGVDMQTAMNSGLACVGVTWGFRSRHELESNGANYVATHPQDILKVIESV